MNIFLLREKSVNSAYITKENRIIFFVLDCLINKIRILRNKNENINLKHIYSQNIQYLINK